MKRLFLAFALLCSVAGTAHAQFNSPYFGVGGTAVVGSALPPLVSVQVGGPLSESVEARMTLDAQPSAVLIGADVFYTLFPRPNLKVYLGAGPDAVMVFPITGVGADLHGTAGLEYRLGGVRGLASTAKSSPLSRTASRQTLFYTSSAVV